MDFSDIVYADHFRAVGEWENALGLWIDRIGEKRDEGFSGVPVTLRRLGLYAAVRIDAGEGTFFNERSGEAKVGPGSVLLLFPEVGHCYFPDHVWSSRWIVWGGREAEWLERHGYLSPDCPLLSPDDGCFAELWTGIEEELKEWSAEAALRRKGLLLTFVSRIKSLQTRQASDFGRQRQLLDTIDWMRRHRHEPPSLEECAARCHLGTAQFRRLFRELTGQNPREFILAGQIARAKELLTAGCSVKETACRLGFRDVFYFMRLFRQKTGLPPGRWRDGGTGRNPPLPS